MTDPLLGATIPTMRLDDAQTDAYLAAFESTMRAARLNTQYPDGRLLARMANVWSSKVHGGLYSGLELVARTGLPTYKVWSRAQTDITIAANQLQTLGDPAVLQRKAQTHPDSAHTRNWTRYTYYSAIKEAPIAPLGEMNVAVRRVDRARRSATFNVVLDKLDASGVFVRYSIDVEQTGDEAIATVDKRDLANNSEGFRALIYQFTSLDAEFTFVKLASMAGLRVERVIKGTIGPFYVEAMARPEKMPSQGLVASFGLDMAAIDVESTKLNDPLAGTMNPETRATYDRLGSKLGYHIFKDRKFVCPRAQVDAMKAFCEARGTRNVIYGV